MKKNCRVSPARVVEALVKESMPEFAAEATGQVPKNARTFTCCRRRIDGIYERVFVEIDAFEQGTAFGIQLSTNFFPECPTVTGPFGYVAALPDLIHGELAEELYPFWYFDGWYKLDGELTVDSPFFGLIKSGLKGIVRDTLDRWVMKLQLEEVVKIAVETYNEVAESGNHCELDSLLSTRLHKNDQTTNGYPVEKIRRQLCARQKGIKSWYLV